MSLNFNIENVRVTEFGVGRDDGNGQTFVAIPVDREVQSALREMVAATWDAMRKDADDPEKYEPSEKHGSTEHLYLPLNDDLAASLRELHEAANLSLDANGLEDPGNVFCYFARLTDKQGRRLTALRRATQFKGVLKSRLIRFVTDSLKLIEDRVFKLDSDFDLLVDSSRVHILRPSGFEFAGKLQEAVLATVPQNIRSIQKDLPFVRFAGIQEYASKHPRAARHLASIRGQQWTRNVEKSALKKLCRATGVDVTESKGKILVQAGHEMAFLEVLDRRRYEVELVKGQPERFKAGSRRKLEK